MPLSDVLSQIPGYAGYQAARLRNQQQDSNTLQQGLTLQALLTHIQGQQRENAMRSELSALGPDATQEQLAGVSAKYAAPGDILKSQTASADRKAQLDSAERMRQATLEQSRQLAAQNNEFRMAQAKTNAEREGETARHNRYMEWVNGGMNGPQPGVAATTQPPPNSGADLTGEDYLKT